MEWLARSSQIVLFIMLPFYVSSVVNLLSISLKTMFFYLALSMAMIVAWRRGNFAELVTNIFVIIIYLRIMDLKLTIHE